jgi:hypothetical protein
MSAGSSTTATDEPERGPDPAHVASLRLCVALDSIGMGITSIRAHHPGNDLPSDVRVGIISSESALRLAELAEAEATRRAQAVALADALAEVGRQR